MIQAFQSTTSAAESHRPQGHDAQARVAVLVPCFNEGRTVSSVIEKFSAALPQATVYVYDNNSSDDTVNQAKAAGAIVRQECLQGKGHVVRRMFADVDADVYILVDGDDTYDAAAAPALLERLLSDGLDMITGQRAAQSSDAYRFGHVFGNRLLSTLVGRTFGQRVTDLLSGYRVLSRRFVKSFPVLSGGFEIETELTVHALELGMPQDEVETAYKQRPADSASKLNTYRDGARILRTIGVLIKEERPLAFFSTVFLLLSVTSVALAYPVFIEFFETGLVPRVPTAVLSTGMMLLAFLSLACGVILDTVTRGRRELKRLFYLSVPGPESLGSARLPRDEPQDRTQASTS